MANLSRQVRGLASALKVNTEKGINASDEELQKRREEVWGEQVPREASEVLLGEPAARRVSRFMQSLRTRKRIPIHISQK